MIEIVHDRHGLHLPQIGWWLDPRGRKDKAFVSHAHADHIGKHGQTLCTPATRALMAARSSLGKSVKEAPFGEKIEIEPRCFATLLPAGHVLGSAQIFLETDEGSLLYTGDFKRGISLTCEVPEFRRADALIMETTFGLPRFVFPPVEETRAEIADFCRTALEFGDTPVLFAYSLGKAQEICSIVANAGLPVVAHEAVTRMSKVCATFRDGIVIPRTLRSAVPEGHVLVAPPSASRSPAITAVPQKRTATITGWALQPGSEFRYGVDQIFPLSDHADYTGLLQTVDEVKPKTVYAVHGYVREFAADLRRRGIDAWAPGHDEQIELDLAE